ncbi:histone-lysine N-methyltransferase, H3 lysine-9 specific SUVH3 [Cicer arietinum]|uniref:Histone-lysine N-methyltransferase, H3 lysine-9 specific SUVH6 n=1 Tax=Cicer arietinum TaxID=3827 RepID=A0A1S2YY06_CICAR|nr:histone-lysine N-methyltransferase, H3 lysine-9 specific SUVH6 [Cicer arietinum]
MNLESSRGMAMSAGNGHSEEEFRKPLMENEDSTVLAQPKFKRRKVSAIRDFPAECGPFCSGVGPILIVNNGGFGSVNGTIVEDKSGEHFGGEAENDPQDSEFKNNSLLTETPDQTSDCGLKEGNPVVSSHQVDGTTLANNGPAKVALVGMETLDMEISTEDSSLEKENPVVSSHQVDGPTFVNHRHAKVASVSMEALDAEFATEGCSLKNENPVVSSHLVDGSTLANDERAKLALVGMETLGMEFATENSVKQDFSYISKSSSPVGEVAMSDDLKSSSSNINIGGSGACVEEAITRRYPPRRKIAAVRDFPRLCGRNAPRLSKDECLKEISLNKNRVGLQDLALDVGPFKKVAAANIKELENNIPLEHGYKRKLADIVQADSEGNDTREKYIKLPEKRNHHQVNINSKAVAKEEMKDIVLAEGTSALDIVYPEVRSPEGKLNVSSGRKVVLGLMSKSECPWRSDNDCSKFKSIEGTNERKRKKVDFYAQIDRSKTAIKTKLVPNHSGHNSLKKKKGNSTSDGMGQLVIREKDSLGPNENNKDFKSVPKPLSVIVPPLGNSDFSGHVNDSVTRNKVRQTLRLFQAVSRKLLQEVEAKSSERERKRIDLQAAKILKENGNYVNTGKQLLGPVPGVEVGDEFQYRVELNMIGLHRQTQGGIDYLKHNGKILATSIVASGGYADELDNSDVLIYTGQGGNVMTTGKEPEDQKLERGNLALKNSSEEKNPVRVIRGSESMDGKSKTYVYDGLYLVESHWQDMGPHGKLVYRFRLRRIPGQPELALKEVKKSKKFKTREGLCVEDISYGVERIPICAVNIIDDEKPPPFKYITSMMYPDCCNLVRPEGCNCTNGCSDLDKCSCVLKNGGEIPFNHNGAIVEAKPLVYECGPKCKCPLTCHNRVSQLGIKMQLEIFKTNSRGWGVRSLNSISSGSFICEYIGEVLEDKEAEQRTGNDEYLFDIGNNNSNNTLWDGLSTLMPESQSHSCEIVKDVGFTIDAAKFGNVGRFVNHSCSPNLYAQNVLYDHHDSRIPHIMLFAAENIPPLQELTYDYNYMIDQVRDSNGNIKKKNCYCGSVECTGRLY